MKAYGEVDVQTHISLISALAAGQWLASRPGRFTPGKSRRYPLDRRLGDPRSGLDDMEKILDPTATPARSQTLYQLRYPGSPGLLIIFMKYGGLNLTWPERGI
jgi:hypothetical protein